MKCDVSNTEAVWLHKCHITLLADVTADMFDSALEILEETTVQQLLDEHQAIPANSGTFLQYTSRRRRKKKENKDNSISLIVF